MARTISDLGWPVATERLSIRPAVLEDAGPMFGYRGRDDVAHWLPRQPDDAGGFAAWLPAALERTLVVERDGALVGDLYLHLQDSWAQAEVADRAVATLAEIGYAFDPDHGGQGLATEAVTALLEICFEGLGVRRVVAHAFADNGPSLRLLERLGLRREALNVRDSLHRSGEWLDGVSYALLAEEWLSPPR